MRAWQDAGQPLPEDAIPPVRRTLGARINAGLHDLFLAHPEAVAFGEDVARKGGVYGVTAGLQARFGADRVFDTMLDETAILGAAQGFGLLGYLPVPEIQYLAYLHNALDQLRGEACSTTWLSDGAFASPMVLRVASFAYQKGFGGHFHNDNAIGALRDIPGLLLATPSRGDDAVRLLRGATALAAERGRVVAMLEPIALYHERDLFEDGDEGWLTAHPLEGRLLPGTVGVYAAGRQDPVHATIADVERDRRPRRRRRGHRTRPTRASTTGRTSSSSPTPTACGCRCGPPAGCWTRTASASACSTPGGSPRCPCRSSPSRHGTSAACSWSTSAVPRRAGSPTP